MDLREMNPDLDGRDLEILMRRYASYVVRRSDTPEVGEYWTMRVDDQLIGGRFTYKWDDGIQTNRGGGSFYLGDGYMDYSGSLDPTVPFGQFRIDEFTPYATVSAWFFHHDRPQAHNGVDVLIPVRVWERV